MLRGILLESAYLKKIKKKNTKPPQIPPSCFRILNFTTDKNSSQHLSSCPDVKHQTIYIKINCLHNLSSFKVKFMFQYSVEAAAAAALVLVLTSSDRPAGKTWVRLLSDADPCDPLKERSVILELSCCSLEDVLPFAFPWTLNPWLWYRNRFLLKPSIPLPARKSIDSSQSLWRKWWERK